MNENQECVYCKLKHKWEVKYHFELRIQNITVIFIILFTIPTIHTLRSQYSKNGSQQAAIHSQCPPRGVRVSDNRGRHDDRQNKPSLLRNFIH